MFCSAMTDASSSKRTDWGGGCQIEGLKSQRFFSFGVKKYWKWNLIWEIYFMMDDFLPLCILMEEFTIESCFEMIQSFWLAASCCCHPWLNDWVTWPPVGSCDWVTWSHDHRSGHVTWKPLFWQMSYWSKAWKSTEYISLNAPIMLVTCCKGQWPLRDEPPQRLPGTARYPWRAHLSM